MVSQSSNNMGEKMKFIVVTGGVISGIGKGVIASSIGLLLKSHGIRVTCIKIDPYINIDAGTFSPYEHGEVFVLDDGGEVDLDLGNYERFLGVKLRKENNLTTGKIYQKVIQCERRGDYLGKTVQVIPHITNAIQQWVLDVSSVPVDSSGLTPEVCVIELGGTVGDIEGMPFIEAFRQLQFKLTRERFLTVHVSLVPEPRSTREQKTKPTQSSVRELRSLGLYPDLIFCRSESPLDTSIREKISFYSDVSSEQLNFRAPVPESSFFAWQSLMKRFDNLNDHGVPVSIALVGKYVKLEDAYASVMKALYHSSFAAGRKLVLQFVNSEHLEVECLKKNAVEYYKAWKTLEEVNGIIVPGGFGERGVEGKIAAAGFARKNLKPFLGICLGMQCAVIEFARKVLDLKDANSTEFSPETSAPVVIDMPEHTSGDKGGTMRLGLRTTVFKTPYSKTRSLYGGVDRIEERHRHRYEVNATYLSAFEENGFHFVGQDVEAVRMEICELQDHPFFIATQFHPEYTSQPLKPNPVYFGFILAASGQSLNERPYIHCSGVEEKFDFIAALKINGHVEKGVDCTV